MLTGSIQSLPNIWVFNITSLYLINIYHIFDQLKKIIEEQNQKENSGY